MCSPPPSRAPRSSGSSAGGSPRYAALVAACTASIWRGRSSRMSPIGRYSSSLRIWPSSRCAWSPTPTRSTARVDAAQALLGAGHREEDRAREQPVEQQELGRVARRSACRGRCAGRPRRRRSERRIVVQHGAARLGQRRGSRAAGPSCRRARCVRPRVKKLPGLVAAGRRLDDADGEGRRARAPSRRTRAPCRSATLRGMRARVVLRHSHSSVETISRARRAFSRAALSE